MYNSYYNNYESNYPNQNIFRQPISINPQTIGQIGSISNQIVSQLIQQYQSSGLDPLSFAQSGLLPTLEQLGSINTMEKNSLSTALDAIKTQGTQSLPQISLIKQTFQTQSASPTAISISSIAEQILQTHSRFHPNPLGEIAYALLGAIVGEIAGIQVINILFPSVNLPILQQIGKLMGNIAGATASHFCYLALGGIAAYH
ncbi:TPA: hypothetical protein RKT18_005481 [Bacillus cereus]|nr:hypothetical protein [Bacillus cereus]